MDDTVRAAKKNQKAKEAAGCCGSTPGLQIMETIPARESSGKRCCGRSSGESTLADNADAAGTATSSTVTKSTAFWIGGFAGLAGITILVFSSGLVSGLKPLAVSNLDQ